MRICPYPFFKATPPGAAPGPPIKTGANVRRFRGCNQAHQGHVQAAHPEGLGAHGAPRLGRLLLNRARAHHDPAHHGANGAAMPTDEDDQDDYFLFNHPEGGTTPLPRHAQPLLLLFRSNPPQ